MFELKLANGKTLTTDNAFELAMFWESGGKSLTPNKPKPKRRKKRQYTAK